MEETIRQFRIAAQELDRELLQGEINGGEFESSSEHSDGSSAIFEFNELKNTLHPWEDRLEINSLDDSGIYSDEYYDSRNTCFEVSNLYPWKNHLEID